MGLWMALLEFRQGSKYPVIEKGSRVCKLIKSFYHSEKDWDKCHKEITSMFTEIKCLAKDLYKEMDRMEIMDLLLRYDKQDFDDLLDKK